jgi:DNA adenine methylase
MIVDAKITAIEPWFGSKRTLAPEVVNQLGRHSYYFEGCYGSAAVLFAKEPSEHEVICDLHGALTNLTWVVQDEASAAALFNALQRVLYGDELYRRSKDWLERFAEKGEPARTSIDWAYHYFIASWIGRNGVAGTARVNYQIATRWTKGGGSGPLRFRNAVDSIPAWCERLRSVHVLRRDVFKVLPSIEDDDGVSIYCDPPYLHETVSGKSRYLCDFAEGQHEQLAKELGRFRRARVVVSYYSAPALEGLYRGWTFIDCSRHKHLHVQNKRGMGRKEAPEVLIINGSAFRPAESDGQLLFAE